MEKMQHDIWIKLLGDEDREHAGKQEDESLIFRLRRLMEQYRPKDDKRDDMTVLKDILTYAADERNQNQRLAIDDK